VAATLPDGTGVHYDPLLSEDSEATDAAREIKACLAANDTSRASNLCDRMLSLHPESRLFEGLRLDIENRERESRLEFIRRLSSELEAMPDLDARIDAIQHALNRYPGESQLVQLLKNTTARRDLCNAVIAEARNEELSDGYAASLTRWYLLRELYPNMPATENEIRRLETLADSQRKMKRRAEFVDAIFRLSSTGEYTRAVYQCINALSEYPNDGGLLDLKKSVEEKALHATELQTFISEGLTFLQSHEFEAALESFGKANALDQSNLQVRYLIGIALLEKARVQMYNDRRKLNVLLDEAKSFIPGSSELQTLSLQLDAPSDENWAKTLIRVEHPETDLQQNHVQPSASAAVPATPEPSPAPNNPLRADPAPVRNPGSFRNIVLFGLALLGALSVGWLVLGKGAASDKSSLRPEIPSTTSVDIRATPQGAQIFVDDKKVGESQALTQLTSGTHTVTVSLAGYDSQTFPFEVRSGSTALQIDLRPILMDVHLVADQPGVVVSMDDQIQGDTTETGMTISGVEPGIRTIKMNTPGGDLEIRLEFEPGKIPVPRFLPPRQIANVLFVGSAEGKSHIECNCAPAGLRVGDLAELIRGTGLELPLMEGEHTAELWLGKRHRNFTVRGSRSPVATIAVFSSIETDK
jgi:tetratricopeptide (TPR) repeat protein